VGLSSWTSLASIVHKLKAFNNKLDVKYQTNKVQVGTGWFQKSCCCCVGSTMVIALQLGVGVACVAVARLLLLLNLARAKHSR
jgi:hypothetical protein